MDGINLSLLEKEFGLSFSGNGTEDWDPMAETENTSTALMAIRLLVCALGLLGNMMVIFVILVLREYRKAVTHWYVLQLAVADSIFLLTLPFKVTEDAHQQWIFSGSMCKAKETILFLNYYSSILFLMVMSIDRYIAVCHAFSDGLQKLRTKRAAFTITLIVWIMSLFLCIPIMLYSDKRGLHPNCKCQYEFPKYRTPEELCKNEGLHSEAALQQCILMKKKHDEKPCRDITGILETWQSIEEVVTTTYALEDDDITTHAYNNPVKTYDMGCSYAANSVGWIAYLLFNFIMAFVVPFLVMSVCYCLIALELRMARFRRNSVTNESTISARATNSGKAGRKRTKSAASSKTEKNRLRVTLVCLTLVLLFLACWLPFHAIHLAKMKGIDGSAAFCAKISAISSVIAYLNSALNPYIYNFIGTRFKKRLRSAAGSIRGSVRKRTSSFTSGGGTVRYHIAKQGPKGSNFSISMTMMTKINKEKSEMESSQNPTNGVMLDVQQSLFQN